MDYKTRLRLAMEAKKPPYTRKELALSLGISTQALGMVLSGKSKSLTAENNSLAAKTLGVNAHWLATGDGEMYEDVNLEIISGNIKPAPNMRLVPVLNKVNAGMYKEIVETHPDDIDYVPVYMPVKHYTFALRVDGDSMEPGFPHGCIVIIDPEVEPKPNDYVIAMNGDNEATFKQLIKDGPDFYLRPRNPRYPIKALGTAKIIGVVCGVQMQSKPGDPTWPV